eukprot:1137815-Pelagomonas_calceolata.AAC.4
MTSRSCAACTARTQLYMHALTRHGLLQGSSAVAPGVPYQCRLCVSKDLLRQFLSVACDASPTCQPMYIAGVGADALAGCLGMGVSAGGEEGGVLNDTGTGTCAGTPLESGGDTEGNESCRSEDGSGSLHNEVVGRSVQGGSQEEGDKRGACGLEGGAEANQQQQQQQQQQGQEQGAGTEGTSEDGGASQLEFSDEEWEQGIAHARLLEVRRALAAARAAAKEALASASVAQGDYK